MIQDAINTLIQLQKQYKETFSIEVYSNTKIKLYTFKTPDREEMRVTVFENAQQLVEWMENNLTPISQ